jgi:hypothetical protein
MRLVDLIEFDHCVCFVVECDKDQICIQYKSDDIWQDDKGIWQIRPDSLPFHQVCSPVLKPAPPELSTDLTKALAAVSRFR